MVHLYLTRIFHCFKILQRWFRNRALAWNWLIKSGYKRFNIYRLLGQLWPTIFNWWKSWDRNRIASRRWCNYITILIIGSSVYNESRKCALSSYVLTMDQKWLEVSHGFNPFLLNVSFWSPWKHQKNKAFPMFSRESKELGRIGKKSVENILWSILKWRKKRLCPGFLIVKTL